MNAIYGIVLIFCRLFLDVVTDFTYLLDILFQFRTGYLEQGLIIYDNKKLAVHYLYTKYFVLDVASILPLDLLQISVSFFFIFNVFHFCFHFFQVVTYVTYIRIRYNIIGNINP